MPYGVVGYDPGKKLLHRWPYHRCTSFLSSRHFHAYHSANSRQNFGPQLIWSRCGLSVQMMPIWCFELFQGTSRRSRGNGTFNGFLRWIDHVWTILIFFWKQLPSNSWSERMHILHIKFCDALWRTVIVSGDAFTMAKLPSSNFVRFMIVVL